MRKRPTVAMVKRLQAQHEADQETIERLNRQIEFNKEAVAKLSPATARINKHEAERDRWVRERQALEQKLAAAQSRLAEPKITPTERGYYMLAVVALDAMRNSESRSMPVTALIDRAVDSFIEVISA